MYRTYKKCSIKLYCRYRIERKVHHGFSKTIITLHNKAGLSQQDVADKLQMAQATLCQLRVRQETTGSGVQINAIAEFYQISPPDLITGKSAGRTSC